MSVHLQSHLRQVSRVTAEDTKSQTGLSNCPRSCMKLGIEPSFLTCLHSPLPPKVCPGTDNPPERSPSKPTTSKACVFPELHFCVCLKSTVDLKVDLFALFPLATRKPRVKAVARLNADLMSHVKHILLLVQYHSYLLFFSRPPFSLTCSRTGLTLLSPASLSHV